jgi:chorismate mutase
LNFKSFITTSAENDLLIQRNKIGNIDTQISELLRKRMEIVDEIAQIKVANNLALLQPDQWKKVVAKYQKAALSDSDYQEFIRNFLDLLHQSSLHRQKK